MRTVLLLLFPLLLGTAPYWGPEVDIEGNGGNFRHGGGAEVFVPLRQGGASLWFLQGGGGYFRDQKIGRLGVGYRQLIGRSLGGGVNLFGDLASSDRGFIYGQLGGGIECFSRHLLFRANGYAPTKRGHLSRCRPGAELQGIDIIGLDIGALELAFPGFDLEGGVEVDCGGGELWGFAGYFWHRRSPIRPIEGPRLRLEYRVNLQRMQLVLGGDYEYNRLNGHTGLGRVELRIPLGGGRIPRCPSVCAYMGRPVVRDRAIWLERISDRTDTGLLGHLIFANNLIDGIGTQTDPATIDNAFALSVPGDIVFLLNDTGTMAPSATLLLQECQQVLGFGNASSVSVTLSNGATLVINDLTGAGRGVVDGSGVGVTFEAATNTCFAGIEIEGGTTAINVAAGIGGVTICDLIFDGQTSQAVLKSGSGSLLIDQSMITNAATGVSLVGHSGGFFIADTQITSAVAGVSILNSGGLHILDTLTVMGPTNGVLVMDTIGPAQVKDVRILDSTFTGIGARGIRILSRTGDVFLLEGNSITGGSGQGIDVDLFGVGNNIVISNNTVDSVLPAGMRLRPRAATDALFDNNRLVDVGLRAINVVVLGSAVGQRNITVRNNEQTGANVLSQGYRMRRNNVAAPACFTILNNQRSPTAANDIQLSNANVTANYEVFDLPNLSANNNGLSVQTVGVVGAIVNTTTPCPLPVIPAPDFNLF